jgi:hypothetical protein
MRELSKDQGRPLKAVESPLAQLLLTSASSTRSLCKSGACSGPACAPSLDPDHVDPGEARTGVFCCHARPRSGCWRARGRSQYVSSESIWRCSLSMDESSGGDAGSVVRVSSGKKRSARMRTSDRSAIFV